MLWYRVGHEVIDRLYYLFFGYRAMDSGTIDYNLLLGEAIPDDDLIHAPALTSIISLKPRTFLGAVPGSR